MYLGRVKESPVSFLIFLGRNVITIVPCGDFAAYFTLIFSHFGTGYV